VRQRFKLTDQDSSGRAHIEQVRIVSSASLPLGESGQSLSFASMLCSDACRATGGAGGSPDAAGAAWGRQLACGLPGSRAQTCSDGSHCKSLLPVFALGIPDDVKKLRSSLAMFVWGEKPWTKKNCS